MTLSEGFTPTEPVSAQSAKSPLPEYTGSILVDILIGDGIRSGIARYCGVPKVGARTSTYFGGTNVFLWAESFGGYFPRTAELPMHAPGSFRKPGGLDCRAYRVFYCVGRS